MSSVLEMIKVSSVVGLKYKDLWKGFAHAYMLYYKDVRVEEAIDWIYLVNKYGGVEMQLVPSLMFGK